MTAITAAQAQELMRQDAALQKGAELVLQGLRHVGSGGASARMLVIFAPEGN